MSYQVLARKWRPRTFREMVGQEHVLQALINALDHDRLHHAYLFTGTRGVGKTTIARILAKCLNCEVGVSSVPCNECSSCVEINEGRFVDLIEVDAASRTKVEDTRELLENVQYAPTRGRYKVYLIDEVHMLSNSSFNALLKTLEEPPPHVKFLLATTDPQKLPVTILSRCLQFNLKNMNPQRIVTHLQFVLEKEMVPFEDAGLWQLARSADGSMRDALSLTDQSIAFGDGKITDLDVRTMLGTIDQSLVYDVLTALIAEDVQLLLQAVADLAEHSPDYSAALAELIATLHRIAIAQALPEAVDNSQGDRQQIYDFAQSISVEDVQLYYQTALLGRRDLPLVPDPRSGFEMVLLRMLAFKPQGVNHLPKKIASKALVQNVVAPAQSVEAEKIDEAVLSNSLEGEGTEPVKKSSAATVLAEPDLELQVSTIAALSNAEPVEFSTMPSSIVSELVPEVVVEPEVSRDELAFDEHANNETVNAELSQQTAAEISLEEVNAENWFLVYSNIKTGGLLQSTVANCQLVSVQNRQIIFLLDERQSTLYDSKHQQYLAELLSDYFSQTVQVLINVGENTAETPAQIIIRRQQERQQQAKVAIESDPVVQQLQELFDATIVADSITPVN
ncbi:MAG: DNA polymerase-3 subunit gamma/tau [Candidatus Endobugula sp.]|jgi:DNA polymerase-3 subunit gamma/tau